jgi:hypothetical protein
MSPDDLPQLRGTILNRMQNFPAPWCVAGGWAIDLFLGQVTRPHADIELAIFRQDQLLLHRHFKNWNFKKFVNGKPNPWPASESLSLPIHEIHARSQQNSPQSLEFLLNERTPDQWVYRRHPNVTRPIDQSVLPDHFGCPFQAPEIVLLFKSKSPRPKDELDFQSTCRMLPPESEQWLRNALQLCHPNHPWLANLTK